MSSAALTVAAYTLIGVVAAALQVLAVRDPDRVSTIGVVLTWAMRRRSTQIGLVFAWWWVGWHFLTAR